jgi:MHS family shikimate/dehydroshikimate transporter-like MFS transporter
MSELFSTRVRYSGASLAYQLASVFAGGVSPLIATYLLKQSGGNPTPIAWYMIMLAAITVVSVFLATESFKTGGEQ